MNEIKHQVNDHFADIRLLNEQNAYLLSQGFIDPQDIDAFQQVRERTQELEHLKDEAERQARTDPLTGILNRRGFQEVADRFIQSAKRTGHPLSLILIDIDHFKRINDTWGHDAGDLVLK